MRIVRSLLVMLTFVFVTGCTVIEWVGDGVRFYQRGRQAAELSNEQIAATQYKKALTAIPLTQMATTATVTPTTTIVPGVTPSVTPIPTPEPTPIPIMWVKPRSGFVRFYNKPGLVTTSSGGDITGGYYPPGTSIWGDSETSSATGLQTDVNRMGVIGAYYSANRPIIAVIATASGSEFLQAVVTAYVELSDLAPALDQTAGVSHSWGHGPDIHTHFWPRPDTSKQRDVIGNLEPGVPLNGPDPNFQVKILEITPDGRMALVRILGIWLDQDDVVEVEAPQS